MKFTYLLGILGKFWKLINMTNKLPEFPVITEVVRDSQIENLDEKLMF